MCAASGWGASLSLRVIDMGRQTHRFLSILTVFLLAITSAVAIQAAPANAATTIDASALAFSFNYTAATTASKANDVNNASNFMDSTYVKIASTATSNYGTNDGDIIRYNTVATSAAGVKIDAVVTVSKNSASRSVTGISGDGTSITYTTATAHGLVAGQTTTIAGASTTGYNGAKVVTSVVDATHFKVAGATTGSYSGTVTEALGSTALSGITTAKETNAAPFDTQITTGSAGAYGGVSYNFAFYEHGTYTAPNTGSPVSLQNVSVYIDDLDTASAGQLQFAEMSGFQKYKFPQRAATPAAGCILDTTAQNVNRCDVSLINTSPVPGTNLTRFLTTDTTNGSNDVKDRANVIYNSMSSIDIRVGVVAAGAGAIYSIAFGNPTYWGGNSGSPTAGNGAYTYTNGANTPPTITGTTPTLNVVAGNVVTLAKSNFGTYFDYDNNPFTSLKITTLPSSGTFQFLLNGVWTAVTQNQVITVADIDLGKLQFIGAYTTSFGYQVFDSLDYSLSSYTLNINVSQQTQTITFSNPGSKTVSTASISSGATTTASGLNVTLTSTTTGVCTISGLNIVLMNVAGTCSVTATQAGNTTYATATPVTQSFTVTSLTPQSITFPVVTDKTWSTGYSFASSATTSASGLTVTLASLTPSVCTVSGLNIVLAPTQVLNTCSITASQSGNGTYAAAVSVTQTFQVVGATYTLTYNGNGSTSGSVPSAATSSSGFIAASNSGSLAKGTSVFSGWYTTSAGTGGTLYAAGAAVPALANITLYAYWVTPTTYTVTYNYQGGTSPKSSDTYTVSTGATALSLPTTTMNGYNFLGWGTSSGATSYVSNPYTPTSSLTLYAVWSANSYGTTAATAAATSLTPKSAVLNGSLSAGSGGLANGSVSSLTICYSASNAVDSNGLLNYNQRCSSSLWQSTTISANGSSNFNVSAGNLIEATTYYSQLKVTFANSLVTSGAVISFTTLPAPVATTQAPVMVSSKTAIVNGAINPNANNLTKVAVCVSRTDSSATTCDQDLSYTGYTSWNATTGSQSIQVTINNLSPHTTYYYRVYSLSDDGGITTMHVRRASVNPNQLGPVYTEAISSADQKFARQAITTSGAAQSFTTAWADTNAATSVGQTTASINGQVNAGTAAIASADISTVKLCYSTASTVSNTTGLLTSSPVCSSDLWAASSKSVTANGSLAFTKSLTGLAGVTTYYSQMQVVFADGSTANGGVVSFATVPAGSFTVTFKSNYTSGPSDLTQSTNAQTSLSSNSFTRAGYTFAGWNTQAGGGGTSYADGALYAFNANLSLYAQWTANVYTISWNATANGGSAMSPLSTNYTFGVTGSNAPTPVARTGYTFNGWFSSAVGGSLVVGGGSAYSPNASQTLYAQWTAVTYTITWDATTNGGSVTPTTTDFTLDNNLVSAPIPDPVSGKNFLGWYSLSSGGSKIVAADGTFSPTSSRTLYGQWALIPYTVTWDATTNGGTAISPVSQDIAPTQSTTTPTPANRTGYTFNGWFDAATNGNSIVLGGVSYTPTASITLFAQWVGQQYTVTWNSTANGGVANTPATSSFTVGGVSLNIPTPPARTGYSFNGWFTSQTGGSKISGTTFQPSATETLYAQWAPITYNISYSVNTGSGSPSKSSDTYTSGDAGVNLPTVGTMTKSSSNFAGWSLTAGVAGAGGQTISGAFTTSQDVTLYAVWAAIGSHTLTFHAHYPNTTDATATQSAGGTAVALSSNSFSFTGYHFVNWSVSADGTGSYVSDGDNYNFDAGALTLYATWAPNTYTITWDATTNGGSVTTASSSYTTAGTAPTAPTPSARAGYTFNGWYSLASNGLKVVDAGATTTTIADETLYAVWTPDSYRITWDMATNSSGAVSNHVDTFTVGDPQMSAPTPSGRTGYSFAGWFTGASGGSASLQANDPYSPSSAATFYAHWAGETYTVTYDPNTGTGTASRATDSFTVGSTSPLSLPTVGTLTNVVAGVTYVFNGWSEMPGASGAGGTKITGTYSPQATVSLYAIWVAPGSNTVTYHENYGSNDTGTQSANGVTNLVSSPFTRDGYSFDTWTTNADGTGTRYADSESYDFSASIDIYANWTAFTVTFTAGAGSGTAPAQRQAVASLPGAGSMIAPSGSTFSGWQCPLGSATLLAGATFIPTANIECVAIWSTNPSHTVLFHSNFGADPTVTQSANVSGALRTNGFAKDGYRFEYWTTAVDGSGSQYQNSGNYDFAADLVLYANWSQVIPEAPANHEEPVKRKIVLILDKKIESAPNDTKVITVGDPAVVLPNLEQPGFTFVGWALKPEAPKEELLPSSYLPSDSITIYAQWVGVSYKIFLKNSPTLVNSVVTYTNGAKPVTLPKLPNGLKAFMGWSTSATSAAVVENPFTTKADVILYPVWSTPKLIRSIYFKGDSSVLLSTTKNSLKLLAKSIVGAPVLGKILIQGWVLATGASSSFDAKLSKSRATTTASFLKGLGVNIDFLAQGKGIAADMTAKARRVDIYVAWQK
jgi:uncharacterized repeat protein (TIGR02543 family)